MLRKISILLAGIIIAALLLASIGCSGMKCNNCSMKDPKASSADKAGKKSADDTKSSDKANPVDMPEFTGITITAEQDYDGIENFRVFGGKYSGSTEMCEFVANGNYTSKYGQMLKKGDSFKIGKAYVLRNTDGYGNSGTKLILESAEPKKGLTFYCYSFDAQKSKFKSLDYKTVQDILNGNFTMTK